MPRIRIKFSAIAAVTVMALALLATLWANGSSPSEAQQGAMHNCPEPSKWAVSVWDGDDGTDSGQALATCGPGAVAVVYYIDPYSQVWSRWFAGRPDISNLTALNNMQGVIALGGAGALTPALAGSFAQQGSMQSCPQPGKWSIAVWNGPPHSPIGEALATCVGVEVEAAYSIDAETQVWSRYFLNRPEISTLMALDNMQGVIALGSTRSLILQEGNNLPKTLVQTRPAQDLEDNLIGDQVSLGVSPLTADDAARYVEASNSFGFKWKRLSLEIMDWPFEETVEYTRHYVDPVHDQLITNLANSGVTIVYCIVFWDAEIEPVEGGYDGRFKTEEEIQRYLDYARFIVRHFKDRIQYYEILNESFFREGNTFSQQHIEVADYINLVKRVVPVIREEYPEAKIVAGPAPALYEQACYDYEMGILESDVIMPIVDAVSWHPGAYPAEYSDIVTHLYRVPQTVQEIKDVASAHGFTGEYICEELAWPTPLNPGLGDPFMFSETVAAKYYARGIVDHLGVGVTALVGQTHYHEKLPKMDVIRNLATIMAGAQPTNLPIEIQSEATNIRSYTFSLSNGDHLVALWTDGVAVEGDPGVEATLTLPGFSAQQVTGIDVLNGFEQQMITGTEDGNLVIRNLLVKDYPIILRFSDGTSS